MQPEPRTTSTSITEELTHQDPNTSSQYGLQHKDGSSDDSRAQACDVAAAGTSTTSPQRSEGRSQEHGLDRGLSDQVTASTQKNRVQEYERLASAERRANSGPLFEVLRSPRTSGRSGNAIALLPNEILTHVLAHLSPTDLAATALVSRRFHKLVTTPHAWRSAFARYFPGPDAIEQRHRDQDEDPQAIVRAERRTFTRLTSKASWRSEYVLRTRLLRSLSRGKPVQPAQHPSGQASSRHRVVSPEITYGTEMFSSINHLHATWSSGVHRQSVKLVHGADDVGIVSASDPLTGKLEKWGRSDPQLFVQFNDRFPGDAQYGMGPGDVVGAPNVMDVSQPYGMIYGEGFPGGLAYYRTADEMRGGFLPAPGPSTAPYAGVPSITSSEQSVTSVWLTKSSIIPTLTDNLIGMLCGYSTGILVAHSLGASTPSSSRTTRYEKGEVTAAWALSPGVPIIAIAVDDDYSLKRQAQNRIWAVVLNALGEVYVLTKFPRRSRTDNQSPAREYLPWSTGRSVYFNLVEPSRRIAKPDPYDQGMVDGSYSPRSSWNGMCLSDDQISAETAEIQAFTRKKPRDFQKVCLNWDMRLKLVVDFAGDDEHHAGETIVVVRCGFDEGTAASMKRFTRVRCREDSMEATNPSTPSLTSAATPVSSSPSIFGVSRSPVLTQPTPFSIDQDSTSPLERLDGGTLTPRPLTEEWRTSTLQLSYLKKVQLTACAIDESILAVQTQSEDPLLNLADASVTSSPSLGPWSSDGQADSTDVPGQRARLMAVGTNTGCVLVWNIREQVPRSSETINTIRPVRIIHTDSPQISSLALTSLYLVHGGSDGLVQAWDPLASDTQPIRTLHSRFSSRARRQLIQAQASSHGIGVNMYAAAAISLDPDPSVLRGVVALGNKLRYWAYSSSAADQYKSHKRRLRRSEHGNNQGGDKFLGTSRTNLKSYIAGERLELEREKQQRQKQASHLADRFGTQLLGGSEEEMLAYAAMLSQESHAMETLRRASDATDTNESNASAALWSSDLATTSTTSPASPSQSPLPDDSLDADIAEAIRQSLSSTPTYEVSMRPAKTKGRKSSGMTPSPSTKAQSSSSKNAETDLNDLDFAIQLSLAEQTSQSETSQPDQPLAAAAAAAAASDGKGKQRQT